MGFKLFIVLSILILIAHSSIISKRTREHEQLSLNRYKRFVPFNRKHNAPCVAPGNKPGHCKFLRDCLRKEFKTDILKIFDFACVINEKQVGVCCPHNELNLQTNIGSNLVFDLPIIADAYDNIVENQESLISEQTRGCGKSTYSKENRDKNSEWPWMAALIRKPEVIFCGGVLITDQHVLSAAHCLRNYRPEDVRVRLGEYDIFSENETRSRDFQVINFTVHADFSLSTYEHDIAILKLNRATSFNSYIWPICLPPPNLNYVNQTAVVIGWGKTHYEGHASDILMEVEVPVWSNERCSQAIAQNLNENQMCAAAYEGGRDSCQGDSGGPLMLRLKNDRWINIGVVSWGIKCGIPNRPGIYTRVDKHVEWIMDNCHF